MLGLDGWRITEQREEHANTHYDEAFAGTDTGVCARWRWVKITASREEHTNTRSIGDKEQPGMLGWVACPRCDVRCPPVGTARAVVATGTNRRIPQLELDCEYSSCVNLTHDIIKNENTLQL